MVKSKKIKQDLKSLICASSKYLATNTKSYIWRDNWGLGYLPIQFRGFPNVSQFHKILSLNSFDKSSVNSYTEFFILDIISVLLVVNETCTKTLPIIKTI